MNEVQKAAYIATYLDFSDSSVEKLLIGGMIKKLSSEQIASFFRKVCLDYEYDAIVEAFSKLK